MLLVGLIATLGVFTDAPEKMIKLFDQSILAARQIATAGDLRSMSNMLDYNYMRRGRYPREDKFKKWLVMTFKENNIKDLSLDHWGNPYVYTTADKQKSYILISPGPDGKVDTSDDMKVTGP